MLNVFNIYFQQRFKSYHSFRPHGSEACTLDDIVPVVVCHNPQPHTPYTIRNTDVRPTFHTTYARFSLGGQKRDAEGTQLGTSIELVDPHEKDTTTSPEQSGLSAHSVACSTETITLDPVNFAVVSALNDEIERMASMHTPLSDMDVQARHQHATFMRASIAHKKKLSYVLLHDAVEAAARHAEKIKTLDVVPA